MTREQEGPPRMPTALTTAQTILAGLVLCAGSVAAMGSGTAQPTGHPTGQSFDSVDLAIAAVDGVITLKAEAGWVWRDGQTNRMVLDRDVEVEIGGSVLNARRADLWLRKIDDGVYQVFGIFEDLTSADGSFSGHRVPVRAVVRLQESIKLRLGARFDEMPGRDDLTKFMDRSDELYQQRVLGVKETPKEAINLESALRWAPKEMPSGGVVVADNERSLPMPVPGPKMSRVERVLARSRGQVVVDDQRVVQQPSDPAQPSVPGDVLTNPVARSEPSTTEPVVARADDQAAEGVDDPRAEQEPIFKATGIFSIAIDGKVVLQGAQEGAGGEDDQPATITAEGGVTMQYQDPASRQTMDLEAERAVIFLKDGNEASASPSQMNASEIEGIYLEGGVFVGNADWSVRSPKVYVDLANDKMLMLDAVFWTVDQRTNMPLYLRAKSVRQTSRGEFEAEEARIANSAFFEPDLSIGVSKLKISIRDEQRQRGGLLGLVGTVREGFADDGGEVSVEPGSDLVRRVFIDGRNITLRLGSVPIFWLPVVKGNTDAFPLREIQIGDSNRSGLAIKTRWDAFSLFGVDSIPGVKADLQLDYYGERGIGFGLSGSWDTNGHRGNLYSYLLPDDNGTDITSGGRKIDRAGETRGMISFDDIWRVGEPWTIVSKGTFISDEAYVPALEEQRGRETVDFDSLLRVERTDERTQFALELSGSPNDFFAAEHLLQSPGYGVDKIPEASFVSVAHDLFPEIMPGVFEYQFEASIGAMRLRFSEVTAAEYGFDSAALSGAVFGTAPGVSLADTQRALGLNEDTVGRFDTRHEVVARFDVGDFRVTPFVVGRITAYDTSFDTFSPTQTDNMRYWGAVGTTVATTLTKVNDSASSDFFDIHRMRHIVEPSVTIWQADSGFAAGDTPIFDDDIEGLIRGTMIRAGIDQTWQTKRGGPGRWRDADILKINTEYVWSSDRTGTSVIPDYFAARPELSNPGTYVSSEIVFSPTDVLAFSGSAVFDIDLDKTARTSAGVIVQHHPGFVSSIEYRDIRAIDSTFLTGSTRYTLTDKYTLATSANYNFDRGDFQNFFARVERQFQIGTLGIALSFDNIRDETSIGVVFRPFGTSGVGAGAGGDFLNDQ